MSQPNTNSLEFLILRYDDKLHIYDLSVEKDNIVYRYWTSENNGETWKLETQTILRPLYKDEHGNDYSFDPKGEDEEGGS